MTLPYCPPLKRSSNGNHLQLRPKIGRTKSESSLSRRLHQLLNPRLFHSISSARELGASIEGPRSRTHTPNASIKLPRKRVHLLRPISWSVKKKLFNSKTKTLNTSNGKTAGTTRDTFKHSSESSSAKPRKDPSEFDCWTCGQKGHYSGDCPEITPVVPCPRHMGNRTVPPMGTKPHNQVWVNRQWVWLKWHYKCPHVGGGKNVWYPSTIQIFPYLALDNNNNISCYSIL